MFRSANPALNENIFNGITVRDDRTMSLNGTVGKTAILLALVVVAAALTWGKFANEENVQAWIAGGAIGGLIMALVTIFKKQWSPVTAPIYAVLEGLFLGAVSAAINAAYPGIAFQAVCLTFGTLACMLFAYRTGIIRATEKFKTGVIMATGGIFLVYMLTFILGFFNIQVPFIHASGPIGIGISIFIVIIASLNLILDFDFIETGVRQGAPKYMEWYGAFGLIVTLVWLYLEILRLLAKLRGRN